MTTYASLPVFPPYFELPNGRPSPSVLITVYDRGTTDLATLYADREKATPLDNPFTADSLGNAEFYADPGQYDAVANGETLPFSVPSDAAEPIDGAAVVAAIPSGTYAGIGTANVFTGAIAFRAAVTNRAADTTEIIAKPLGEAASGLINITNDDVIGYLQHLHTGPNSASAAGCIGIGTDAGNGNGILVSVKAGGYGLAVVLNPSATGSGLNVLGYNSANFPARFDLFTGSKPVIFYQQTGAGFGDGVTTAGSPVLTSATAAFVAGDVGATVTQLTTRASSPSAIPAGTTIISRESATSVTLSANATANATAMNFLVGGRTIGATTPAITEYYGGSASQKWIRTRVTAADAQPAFQVGINGGMDWGAGGASAVDTSLYRSTNGRLTSDHQIRAVEGVATKVISGAGIVTAADGDFSRAPTDGAIAVVGNSTDSTVRVAVRSGGVWKVGPALLGETITVTGAITGAALKGTTLRVRADSGQQIEGRDLADAVTKFSITANGEPSWGSDATSSDVRYMNVAARARFGYNNGLVQIDDNGTNKPVVILSGAVERIRANPTGLGFFGATPVAKPTLAAAATDLATAITLANDIRTRLIAYGLAA